MRIDFARLNHILIPKTKEERDRFRRSHRWRLMLWPLGVWSALTDEGRTLAVVAPLAGAVAADVRRTSAYVLFCLLAGALLGSLLAARLMPLVRASLHVTAPAWVSVGDDVVFGVTLRGVGPAAVRVRGPFLPWDGRWLDEAPPEKLLRAEEPVHVSMRARFVGRGLHHLDVFTAAAVTPLGLACGPSVESEGVKVWVVPRIANVTRLTLSIATRHQPGGVALASKAGESMDLLGVRPYRPGDPVRDLHARTWARTGSPAVREYQQEYFTRVGVIVDPSDPDVLEEALELAAGVLAHLSRGDALIDVLVVGQEIHELTLGRSLGRLDRALELLAAAEAGPPLDPPRLADRLRGHFARLSCVVAIVTPKTRLADHVRGPACTELVLDDVLVKAIRNREELAW